VPEKTFSFGVLFAPGCVRAIILGVLNKLMELAGFFTAHAVWTVSLQQGPLAPILVTEGAGERSMTRFDKEKSMELAVAKAQDLLDSNSAEADRGILLYDAFVTLDEGRCDAIIVQGVDHDSGTLKMEIIQPYRPPNAPGGFAVMQPKVSFPAGQVEYADELIEAFFEGLDSHEEGGPLWTESILAVGA
jgi:hypothetical protein